ncbi:2-oxo acid dehydrogenase subunit E2 [Streptomyces tanashiensis]|uniref:2-oxo acid dehydrogenase subunit E2 n=1 Tax=Streptomyces tanashiensis TaxID=67367 RepID=A0ABY6QPS9_9ACTN|nr:2-oxo acid dehydrogenase subunit E2 [Streptomyces tanashiensis]
MNAPWVAPVVLSARRWPCRPVLRPRRHALRGRGDGRAQGPGGAGTGRTARGGRDRRPLLTVTNLGDQDVEAVSGVVHPPQVALVGLGRIVQRPVAVNGPWEVRPVVTATQSADHRAADGARLLTTMDRLLRQPEDL